MHFLKNIKSMPGKVCLLVLLLSVSAHRTKASEWQLKKNSSRIRIYAQSQPGSEVKALKAEFEANATVGQLASLLSDIGRQESWVYSTTSSKLIKRVSNNELIYYTEKRMPWPLSNRDVVIDMKWKLDTVAGTLKVNARSISGGIPEKSGIVRVPVSEVTWNVRRIGPNTIKIDYIAQANPGGTIPAWVTNMFLTKGPYETFVNLREQLEKAK